MSASIIECWNDITKGIRIINVGGISHPKACKNSLRQTTARITISDVSKEWLLKVIPKHCLIKMRVGVWETSSMSICLHNADNFSKVILPLDSSLCSCAMVLRGRDLIYLSSPTLDYLVLEQAKERRAKPIALVECSPSSLRLGPFP